MQEEQKTATRTTDRHSVGARGTTDSKPLENSKASERHSVGGSSSKNSSKHTYSYAFKQQILRAWQPVPTLGSTVTIFVAFGKKTSV